MSIFDLSEGQRRALIGEVRGSQVSITRSAQRPAVYFVSVWCSTNEPNVYGISDLELRACRDALTIADAVRYAEAFRRAFAQGGKRLPLCFNDKALEDFIVHRRGRYRCDLFRTMSRIARRADLRRTYRDKPRVVSELIRHRYSF